MSGGDTDSLLATSQRFALKYSELRGEASGFLASASRSPESIERIHDIAQRVQSTDQDIASWLISIPDKFRYKTLCWVRKHTTVLSKDYNYDDAEAFPGRVDTYPDFVTASAWNIGRASRLLLASLAIRLTAWICAPVSYHTTSEYETSRHICEGIISEIIASVPYHFGWHLKHKTQNEAGLSGFACGEEGPGKALPSLFLLWSLTCVKNSDMASEEQRAWARGRLKFIASQVGLKYAHVINEVCPSLSYSERLDSSDSIQLNFRFPSMMIRMDGSTMAPDPLQGHHQGGSKFSSSSRFMEAPSTPESPPSAEQSRSPE
jgi:hypothetical protein